MELNARNGNTCWPHFPGVIARVDYGSSVVNGVERPLETHEATIFGLTEEFGSYEQAVAWCVEMKDHARALEEMALLRAAASFAGMLEPTMVRS
jgi:hypothetical protein